MMLKESESNRQMIKAVLLRYDANDTIDTAGSRCLCQRPRPGAQKNMEIQLPVENYRSFLQTNPCSFVYLPAIGRLRNDPLACLNLLLSIINFISGVACK